ncbi:MAG: GGDEF domain-containing protein [Zoogloeaceae bacterium]|jgi:diguanylate cyclase (GGDEF)-like protein|nr:GGDEF domain-containing protein [Zoogloeaceae bacterium]
MSFPFFSAAQIHRFYRRLASLIADELLPDEFPYLLTPAHHPALLTSKRAMLVVNRARFIACLFATLTPLWSVVDYIFFPTSLWLYLLGLRILTSLAFCSLVIFYHPNGTSRDAYRSLGILALIPATFYLASHIALASFQLTEISAAVAIGYVFLPFVLLTCLSIFPLTALESLALACPILLAQGLSSFISQPAIGSISWLPSFAGTFWLLAILTGIAMLASMSQLALMLVLVRQASHDPLTRAFTRRSGEELLDLQFSIASRTRTPLALAFVDLDHFKSVNDLFGHEAGDLVLKKAAETINRMMRTGDILVRWGGEEFLIIMPNTNIQQANIALTRLYQKGLAERQDGKTITASLGIAERIRDAAINSHRLIEIADNRMYLAKNRGRNLVIDSG